MARKLLRLFTPEPLPGARISGADPSSHGRGPVPPAGPRPVAAYQPTRLRSSLALRCSLRRSRPAWRAESRITARVKKTTTPSEKKVTIRSSVSPTSPSPLSLASSAISPSRRIRAERYPVARRGRRILRVHRRDPEGEPEQVRVRPRAGRDQARPLPLLVGRLPDRRRLRSRHAVARRRP